MLCPPLTHSPMVANWIERHRHRGSFALHIVGIPVAVVGLLMLPISIPTLSVWVFLLSLSLFLLGYAFQFLGHALEGSEPGEIIALKRKLKPPPSPLIAASQSSRSLV